MTGPTNLKPRRLSSLETCSESGVFATQSPAASITDVSRIHVQGGSILRTARANPTVRDEEAADPDWRLHASLESLRQLGVGALVTIGGDDTAFSASQLAAAAGGDLRVVH